VVFRGVEGEMENVSYCFLFWGGGGGDQWGRGGGGGGGREKVEFGLKQFAKG